MKHARKERKEDVNHLNQKRSRKAAADTHASAQSMKSPKTSAKRPKKTEYGDYLGASLLAGRPAWVSGAALFAGGILGLGALLGLKSLLSRKTSVRGAGYEEQDDISVFQRDREHEHYGTDPLGRSTAHFDTQYTGAYPRYTGAISSVTGGNPEDINYMPATRNPDVEGPIYDGSQLRDSEP